MERLPIPSCKQNLCRLHKPFFYGSGTDVYGSGTDVYGMRHASRVANACRIITVQKESFAPGSNTLHHTRTARMPRVSHGIAISVTIR